MDSNYLLGGGGLGSPQGGTRPQSNVRVNVTQLPNVQCESCEGEVFQEGVFIKKLSALLSPTGEEAMVPIPTFVCAACGHVNEEFKPGNE